MYIVGGKTWEPKSSITDLIEILETAREKSTCLKNQIAGDKNYRQTAQETEIREKTVDAKDQKMSQHNYVKLENFYQWKRKVLQNTM